MNTSPENWGKGKKEKEGKEQTEKYYERFKGNLRNNEYLDWRKRRLPEAYVFTYEKSTYILI